ncbi:MAG: hypothetical protein ABTQ25_00765, partial [Nitrosomonas ureae]
PPTQNDLQKYQSNKSLPNITFNCASKLTDRIFGFIVFVVIIFIFYLNTTVALILSSIFGAVLLVFVLGLGQKMISEIEFVAEGIFFYTRFYRTHGIGGKFYVPYEKCYMGWMPFQGDIIFFKWKTTICHIISAALG